MCTDAGMYMLQEQYSDLCAVNYDRRRNYITMKIDLPRSNLEFLFYFYFNILPKKKRTNGSVSDIWVILEARMSKTGKVNIF